MKKYPATQLTGLIEHEKLAVDLLGIQRPGIENPLLSTPDAAFMIAPRLLCSPDAMDAQRNIVVEIMAPGDECISPLRGNQDRLHDESHDHFDFTLCQFATTMLDPLRRSASRTEDNWQYRCRRRSACWSATIWNGCQQMHGYIRSYWSIEKHCHWVLGPDPRSVGVSMEWLSVWSVS